MLFLALQPEDTQKAKKYADRALETYRQVLQKNEGNIYAANGIGAAIAELGDYNTAQKVFMMVSLTTGWAQKCIALLAPSQHYIATLLGSSLCVVQSSLRQSACCASVSCE